MASLWLTTSQGQRLTAARHIRCLLQYKHSNPFSTSLLSTRTPYISSYSLGGGSRPRRSAPSALTTSSSPNASFGSSARTRRQLNRSANDRNNNCRALSTTSGNLWEANPKAARTAKSSAKPAPPPHKKKQSPTPAPAVSGRVALYQQGVKSGARPKVCSGCGTEVIGGKGGVVGRDQAAEHSSSYSKTAAKMARYADTFDKQASDFICNRCKALKRNDVWAAYDALRDVEPGVFMAQLKSIVQRRRFALCIYVLDATDPEFTAVNSLRNAIGSVPVILVVNKVDLVPRMSNYDLNAILHRLKMSKNVAGLFATSASTGAGVVELAECILGQLKGRDVFVVGSANVGKSSLVKALAPTIADCVRMKGKAYSKRRDMAHNLNVTGSHLPGTTLQALRIPCFATLGNALWDTPGIINTSALGYSLFPSHLMDPLNIPTPLVVPDNYSEEGRTRICYMNEGQSLLVEATWMGDDENCCFARLDMTNGGEIECRAYLPPSLRLRVVPTKDAPREARIPINYVRERKASVEKSARGNSGLADEYARPLVPFQDATTGAKEWDKTGRRYAMDITLASLGWISFLDSIPFTLVPMVVEGSKWGKRKSLYPRNLNGWLEANGTPEHEVTELTDARKRDISDTIRMAKKNQYGGNKPDFSDDDDDGWEGYDGDGLDDSWAR